MSVQKKSDQCTDNALLQHSIQMRVNPKLYFTVALMAKHQRRSIPNLIEQWVKKMTEIYVINAITTNKTQNDYALFGKRTEQRLRLNVLIDRIWSPEPSERFVLMALHLPHLLTDTEEQVWHWIKGKTYFWRHFSINLETPTGQLIDKDTWPLIDQVNLRRDRLQHYWPMFEEVLDGKAPVNSLRFLLFTEVGRQEGEVEQPDGYPYVIRKMTPPKKSVNK